MIVEGGEITDLQLRLAAELVGMPVIPAAPGTSDVALKAHLAAVTAAAPSPPEDALVDPELLRRLQEFERERDDAA